MIELLQPQVQGDRAMLLALLLAGHVLADFPLQTQRMAREKGSRPLVLLRHVAVVFVAQAILLFAFWTWQLLAGLGVLAISHGLVDLVKARVDRARGPRLSGFFADQLLHLAALFALAAWLGAQGLDHARPWAWMPAFAGWSLVAAGFIFNAKGATAIVRLTLARFPQLVPGNGDGDRGEYRMGSLIGSLERYLVLALVLADQWVALGLVIAAKSMVRRDFSDDFKSEYYLIGTLASILVAVATALLLRVLL